MFAFLPTLGFGEMVLLEVLALLLYGREMWEACRDFHRFLSSL